MRTLLGLLCLTLGLAGGDSRLDAEEKNDTFRKWEYRVLTKGKVLDLGKNDLAAGLNQLGDAGWELVVTEPTFIFKRSKTDAVWAAKNLEYQVLLAQSDVEQWKDRLAWTERMFKKGFISQTQLQTEEARLSAAEAALERLRKELKALPPEPKK